MVCCYISPFGFKSFAEYHNLLDCVERFGWRCAHDWERQIFSVDQDITKKQFNRMIKSLNRVDLYIAKLPTSCSGAIELGYAYGVCEELFLVCRDAVHFTQASVHDSYINLLSRQDKVRTCVCDAGEIAEALETEYIYLIA